MKTTTLIAAILVAITIVVPTGLAGWGAYGRSQPDNKYNANDGYQFADGPGSTTNRVYFNTWASEGPAGIFAPDSAMAGSRIDGAGDSAINAVLGVWADCNHDGYIGFADGALLEYRVEASAAAGRSIDTNICPVVADTAANAGTIHNNGGWVTELIPIVSFPPGSTPRENNTNWRYLEDPNVKIWGDFGEPKTPTTVPGGLCSSATINPPFGANSTRSTGGILRQADCDASVRGFSVHQIYVLASANDPTGTVAQ